MYESDAVAAADATLGFGGSVESRVSVGRSDVIVVRPSDVLADQEVAAHLETLADQFAFARLALQMSLRPRANERFTHAFFSVVLEAPDVTVETRPFARDLAPDRLTAGRFTIEEGIRFGVRAGMHGAAEASAEASSSAKAELQLYYVVAEGVGESDPAWRYKTTDTMPELEGSYQMGLIAQIPRGVASQAQISLEATVRRSGRSTNVRWAAEERIARMELPN